jgi:hypothetical protein
MLQDLSRMIRASGGAEFSKRALSSAGKTRGAERKRQMIKEKNIIHFLDIPFSLPLSIPPRKISSFINCNPFTGTGW